MAVWTMASALMASSTCTSTVASPRAARPNSASCSRNRSVGGRSVYAGKASRSCGDGRPSRGARTGGGRTWTVCQPVSASLARTRNWKSRGIRVGSIRTVSSAASGAARAVCEPVRPGATLGFCRHLCPPSPSYVSTGDCVMGSRCFTLAEDFARCFRDCEADTDCFEGELCDPEGSCGPRDPGAPIDAGPLPDGAAADGATPDGSLVDGGAGGV